MEDTILDETSPSQSKPSGFKKVDISAINPVAEQQSIVMEQAYLGFDSTL